MALEESHHTDHCTEDTEVEEERQVEVGRRTFEKAPTVKMPGDLPSVRASLRSLSGICSQAIPQ